VAFRTLTWASEYPFVTFFLRKRLIVAKESISEESLTLIAKRSS